MNSQMPSEFWDKLIDWDDFERFVQKMYEEDPNLIVQHNVTLVGKSGAKASNRCIGYTENKDDDNVYYRRM